MSEQALKERIKDPILAEEMAYAMQPHMDIAKSAEASAKELDERFNVKNRASVDDSAGFYRDININIAERASNAAEETAEKVRGAQFGEPEPTPGSEPSTKRIVGATNAGRSKRPKLPLNFQAEKQAGGPTLRATYNVSGRRLTPRTRIR